jgi:hypothetical protein
VTYGQQFGAVVVPMNWELHAAAEHGVRPQASLNTQLVDVADIVIAIFWHRLGSPTGEAESGTVEEIDKAHANGAYVAILRCARDANPRELDPAQLQKLNEFCKRSESNSLMLDYNDAGGLAQRVDAILTQAITRSATRVATATERPVARADVWPRIERREGQRGIMSLVLSNTGVEPALHVRHRLEEESPGAKLPIQMGETGELGALAPGGEAPYTLGFPMSVAPQARCVVTWEDSAGEHQNVATLKFF